MLSNSLLVIGPVLLLWNWLRCKSPQGKTPKVGMRGLRKLQQTGQTMKPCLITTHHCDIVQYHNDVTGCVACLAVEKECNKRDMKHSIRRTYGMAHLQSMTWCEQEPHFSCWLEYDNALSNCVCPLPALHAHRSTQHSRCLLTSFQPSQTVSEMTVMLMQSDDPLLLSLDVMHGEQETQRL